MSPCPRCGDTSPDVLDVLPDQRRRLSCADCGHVWLAGQALTPERLRTSRVMSRDEAAQLFPTPDDVAPRRLAHVRGLERTFLTENPEPDPRVGPFWRKYQQVFSSEGLADPDADALHYFANSPIGAYAGQMTVFNNAWKEVGPREGARRVAEALTLLLHAPEEGPPEDRLTRLLQPDCPIGLKGWKEALYTKVLCIMQPDVFLPIVTYDSSDVGKRGLARRVWDLELPAVDRTAMTRGRLIFWSNQLLHDLAGPDFAHAEHISSFLWWAKDQPPPD